MIFEFTRINQKIFSPLALDEELIIIQMANFGLNAVSVITALSYNIIRLSILLGKQIRIKRTPTSA